MNITGKKCDDCNCDLEDLGTAGFSIQIENGKHEYHNRHDRKCPECNKRYDINDCACRSTHCNTSFKHHMTNKNIICTFRS